MTSEIRANTIKNRVGLGTVSYTNTGIVVSGIVTANSFSGPYNGTDIVGTGITLTSTDAGSDAGPEVKLFRNSASPANADYLGQLKFAGESSTGVERNYAKITGKILDVTNGSEDGILEFAHIKGGSQTITGRWRSDSLQLLNGTALTVAGTSSFSDHVDIADNKQLRFGGTDFKIEHNTNENYIDSNSGHIYIRANVNDDEGDNIYIQPKSGENSAVFIHDGAVQLYYNDVKTFETTNEGVTLDTNSSSTILRLNSNTDAVSMLQAVGNDLYVKAASSGSIYMIGNGNETKLSIYSNGKLATNGAASVDCGVGGLHLYLGDGARNDYSTAADGLIIEKNGNTGLSIDPGSSGIANIYFPNESNHSIASISHNNSTGEFRLRGEDHVILATNGNTERLRITSDGVLYLGPYKTSTSSLNVPYEIRVAPYGWGQSQDIAAISMGNHSGATGSDDGQIVFKTAYNAHTDANALKESLRINSFGRLMMNHTQTSTPLNDTFLSIYDANSDASAIRPSGVSKNYAMISLHNYGTGVNGDVTGIGFGAGSAFSYTKGSIAFQRQGSYGTGDLVFLTNNDQDTTMVNSTDERMRIRRDGTIRIGGDLYADTDIMMTLRNTAGTGSQIQFHGTGTGNTANDGLRVGYNGTGGQMWLFENGGYLRFATSNNERVRIDEYGAITHTRGDNTTRWDVEFRQTGGISDGNYGGIKWTQNSTGGVHLGGIKLAYANTGRPDLVFSQRNRGGGTGAQETFRIDSDGEHIKTRASTRYENSSVKSIEFPVYFSSGSTFTVVTLGGSYDTAFVAFATLEYIGLYAYAGQTMSGGVRRAYTRRTNNNTGWRDFDNQVSENYGENYRPDIFWENGVLKVTTPGSTQITGFLRVVAHAGNTATNVQITRNLGV